MPHPVLSNADILFEVFRQVARGPDDEKSLRRDTLAKSARVCKTFADLALRVLWERLPSIFPLLNLLHPSFAWLDEGREGTDESETLYDTFVLYSLPDAGQWARFCDYAARVRVLTENFRAYLHNDYDSTDSESENSEAVDKWRSFIVPSVWVHLGRLSRGRPLLPAIRELNWTTTGPDQTELFLLVGPLLHTLRVHFKPLYTCSDDEYDSSLPLLVRTIASVAPAIREFAITAEDKPVQSAIYGAEEMKQLRVLRIDDQHRWSAVEPNNFPDMTRALQNLEELESLTIGLRYEVPADESAEELRALRHLSITDYSGRPQAYTVFRAPSLRSLAITYCESVTVADTACAAISQALVHQFPTITSLALKFRLPDEFTAASLNMQEAIAPLFSLTGLKEFSVHFHTGGRASVKNADVRAILDTFSHLSSLSITLTSPPDRAAEITPPSFPALIELARSGSRLKTLRLSHLRLTEEDLLHNLPITDADAHPLCCRTVEVLTVNTLQYPWKEPKGAKKKLALLVNGLFPNLDVRKSRLETQGSGDKSLDDIGYAPGYKSRQEWGAVLNEVEAMRRSAASGP
ncbi:hypothetical protein BV20DRAFT_1053563 [Pilatotrama ljubarskyi]|nr:hypothetical protein BV20DRAFT_1053563 [Pilatotrama ljubarskyi]